MLPPSTNADYAGALSAAWFLALAGIGKLIPGIIHYALPDGGAGVIAGIDMGAAHGAIVGTFAWMGATQIPYALAQLLVALRYRTLVPIFLLLAFVEFALGAAAAWTFKAPVGGHHPPNHYGVLVAAPLALIFLALALRTKPRS